MDSSGRPTTIILKGDDSRYEEGRAAGAIDPGHFIEQDSNGEYVVCATAGADIERIIAIEDALIGNTIDDAYADDDLVRFFICRRGDEVQAWLKSGENVAKDADLKISTNGELIAHGGTGTLLCKALEARDASAARLRIKVRMI